MTKSRSALIGPLLILLGAFLFFNSETEFSTGKVFAYFWPTLFVIPLGIFFHWLYFTILQRRGVGLVVPGGILVSAGVVCQIAMLFNIWDVMWPGFILSVAIGLLELYWFGGRNKWLLIPINILTVLSLMFFAIFSIGYIFSSLSNGQPVAAAVLIVAGGLMLLMRKRESY